MKKLFLGMFRHGSRSFSLHIVCSSEVPAANHQCGTVLKTVPNDSFGGQCRLPVGRQAMSQARTS
ncbi:MAG: hypothetical protein U9P07_04800 [Pseudomonadota bacterium]|nr:hypothetical protein [Pseudomonadota bacterium]